MRVDIVAHDPAWAEIAAEEVRRWRAALGPALTTVHHIGSTAVARLSAKPVIDLLPEIAPGIDPDSLRPAVEALGYRWLGEHGLPRRRYCRRDDPATGRRLIQAHCWPAGDPEVRRHLAFRDALRADPLLMGAYEHRKRYCASVFGNDVAAYSDCKSGWIETVESRALAALMEDRP